MEPEIVITLVKESIQTSVYIMGPILLTAMGVGLIVSIFQTVTSIQEQTLSFLPKVIAVFAVLLFTFPWIIRLLTGFTTDLFRFMITLTR